MTREEQEEALAQAYKRVMLEVVGELPDGKAVGSFAGRSVDLGSLDGGDDEERAKVEDIAALTGHHLLKALHACGFRISRVQ